MRDHSDSVDVNTSLTLVWTVDREGNKHYRYEHVKVESPVHSIQRGPEFGVYVLIVALACIVVMAGLLFATMAMRPRVAKWFRSRNADR